MQQHHIFVALVLLDVAVQLADLVSPAFQGLQEDTATVAKNAGDSAGWIVRARLRQDGLSV